MWQIPVTKPKEISLRAAWKSSSSTKRKYPPATGMGISPPYQHRHLVLKLNHSNKDLMLRSWTHEISKNRYFCGSAKGDLYVWIITWFCGPILLKHCLPAQGLARTSHFPVYKPETALPSASSLLSQQQLSVHALPAQKVTPHIQLSLNNPEGYAGPNSAISTPLP